MTPFQIHGRNYANCSPENFQIKLMHLSNQLNLMYETDNVDTQVQILTDNFFLALDSCDPFEVKLIKRPPARCVTFQNPTISASTLIQQLFLQQQGRKRIMT